jgi:hypothetical protein
MTTPPFILLLGYSFMPPNTAHSHISRILILKENTKAVVRNLEEDTEERIEEMIDDLSTNEMFGSSILSLEG